MKDQNNFKNQVGIPYILSITAKTHTNTHTYAHLLWTCFQGLYAKMERKIYIGKQYYWQWMSTLHSKCSSIIEQVTCFEQLSKRVDLCSSMSNLGEKYDKYVDEKIWVARLSNGVHLKGSASRRSSISAFVLMWKSLEGLLIFKPNVYFW